MISLDTFFDEMDKIAEEQKYITKDKLKRLGTVMAVAGLGSGAGYATAKAIQRIKPKYVQKLRELIPRKQRPIIGAAVGGVAGGYAAMKKRKKIEEYIEGRGK